MKNILKKILKITAFASAVLAIAAAGLAWHAFREFGHSATSDEVARYEKLPYFADGIFQSPEPLHSYPERVTGGGPDGWARFFLPNPHAPRRALPTVKLDKASFSEKPADFAAYWLGHSSLIIELENKRFLVDPVFGNAAPVPVVVRRFVDSPLEREEIPAIDYVLITHDHYDHLEYATMRYLRGRDTRFIAPFGVGGHLEKWGIPKERILELGWGEELAASGIQVAAERTIHYSGRTFGERDRTLWTSYSLKGKAKRIFISGDSGYGGHFKDIGAKHGPFDLAFIELDGWNPGWPETHMFPEEVIRTYRDIGAKALVPVHWGVFDLARHPWDESIRMLYELADTAGGVNLLTPLMGQKLIPDETHTRAWWEDL
jgi:L-ascorbate metabolism protein UlaG (beta-lactamase superfamily)